MKRRRNILTVSCLCLVIAMTAGLMLACGSGTLKDNVPVKDIAETVNKALSGIQNLSAADENYISVQQALPISDCDDYMEMFQTSGVGIDEYGIFRMKEESGIEGMKSAIQDYIDSAKLSFNENYAPNEKPKLDNAEIRVFGKYVVYAVLSEDDKNVLFSALETALKS